MWRNSVSVTAFLLYIANVQTINDFLPMLKEFWPSIAFLLKFIALYLVLNLLYGSYVNYYSPSPDPVTIEVAHQTDWVLNVLGFETTTEVRDRQTGVYINSVARPIISVYEGCNGLNVMIIFISFLLAYGKPQKALLWFIPLGFVIIHLTNLARIGLLYHVSLSFPDYLYFTHKYFFTGIIYVVVFLLWWLWIARIMKKG